jgi:hypothetical protein
MVLIAASCTPLFFVWLGWAYLTKKMPHVATTPIATDFKMCMSHRKKWALESPAGAS